METTTKRGPNSNLTEQQIIEKFWGDINRWPMVQEGMNFGQDQIRRVAAHMARTGDCLWHAQTVVLGWKECPCSPCTTKREEERRIATRMEYVESGDSESLYQSWKESGKGLSEFAARNAALIDSHMQAPGTQYNFVLILADGRYRYFKTEAAGKKWAKLNPDSANGSILNNITPHGQSHNPR